MTAELPLSPPAPARVAPGMFRCIVADPPWNVKAGPAGGGYATGEKGMRKWNWRRESLPIRDLAYPTMEVEEICELPVARLGGTDCHLYLWTVNAFVEASYHVARAWGFTPSTLLTWAKTPMGGGLGGTFGICSAHILFATRGRVDARARIGQTVFYWKRPYDDRGKPEHSAKPEELQNMAEQVSHGAYAELFARRPRPGWAVWGNEVTSDFNLQEL